MNAPDLVPVIVDALEDIKARDIEVIDTAANTPLFDRIIVASADSGRQTRALAHHVKDKAVAAGAEVLSIEGEDSGEWVLVDLGNIVVHIMQPAIRSHYRLEELWRTSPAARTPLSN
ncbi:MAG: ribosome silencing factor [Thauera sp.]|jgi:ribosome-associated protein|nr:ribosome silencing factor [Thauera sp.]